MDTSLYTRLRGLYLTYFNTHHEPERVSFPPQQFTSYQSGSPPRPSRRRQPPPPTSGRRRTPPPTQHTTAACSCSSAAAHRRQNRSRHRLIRAAAAYTTYKTLDTIQNRRRLPLPHAAAKTRHDTAAACRCPLPPHAAAKTLA
jgi:hypothetical protein